MFNKDDILLHKVTKHTNRMIPFSNYVKIDSFPEQNSQLLNTTATLQYRNRNIADKDAYNIPSAGRPIDDEPFVEAGNHEGDEDIIFTDRFVVLRADKSEPFVFIAISLDYRHMIVGKTNEDRSINQNIYPVEAIQMNEWIGLYFNDTYFRDAKLINEILPAVMLSCDANEPCLCVIMEYIDEPNKVVRFVLGDECFSEITGYIDDALEIHDLDTIEKFRNYNVNLTESEIVALRKALLADIKIYKSDENEETGEDNNEEDANI